MQMQGLRKLADHFLETGKSSFQHYNLLMALLAEPEAPLGVFSYDGAPPQEQVLFYTSLSRVPLDRQKSLFREAVEICDRGYRRPCSHTDKIHLDFLRFYLAVCSFSKFARCPEAWNKGDTLITWSVMRSEFDWSEGTTHYAHELENFNYYANRVILAARAQHSPPLLTFVPDDYKLWFPAPPALVSIDGIHGCFHLSEESKERERCIYDMDNNVTWLYSQEADYSVTVYPHNRTEQIHDAHHITVRNNRLIRPVHNRQAVWFYRHNVRVKQCSDIQWDNLRNLCVEFSADPVKKLLIFVLTIYADDKTWLPVYQPVRIFDHSNNREQQRITFNMVKRAMIQDIPEAVLAHYIGSAGFPV